jgi:RNA polymerase sigma factor (sigma-70 family)
MTMAKVKLDRALSYIRHMLADQGPRDRSDGELLHSFLASDDQHAFAQLVKRHAGLVFRVCRRVLDHEQDAEDAFQATFLALVRRASTIRKHQSVASWLYGVARNMAKDAREAANRRRKYEKRAPSPSSADSPAMEIAWREAQLILDQEIELLPAVRREAFILCCLENRSCAEVAKTLGTKEGTIWSRVSWAKKHLQARLTKRGISLSALLAATAVSNGALVSVPAGLVGSTALAATQLVKGVSLAGFAVSPNVMALLDGMPKALAAYHIKTAMLVFVCLGLAAGGITVAVGQSFQVGQDVVARPVRDAEDDSKARDPAAKPAWLEGSGKDQRIRLSGKILNETGAPANGCKLTVTLKSQFAQTNLPAVVERNQFEVWVPISDARWFYLNAASPDGRRVARETISADQIRQAALDGLELTIKPPERTVDVTVVDKSGGPVRDAIVLADAEGVPFTARTNDRGLASFPVRNRDKLSQLTAWTEDFKIGGYSFNRDPPRDQSGEKFTIELDKCRPQVIRVINDESKAPVPDLKFVLTVGTGPPNYQFIGEMPACEMTTNQKGEAVYRWFPDWKTHSSYVTIPDPHWIKAAKEETVDGVMLVRIKKSRFDARKRVVGRVASTRGSVAGLNVEMRSFQGEEENRIDLLSAFTDEQGSFAADYLPGSTYCIFVNDARYVSKIVDLMPYDPVADRTNAPSLTISEGQPVEIAVTSGSSKSPIAHQMIQMSTPHEYSWRENGVTRNGRGGRRWWVTTDDKGKALTFALPGEKIQGSLYTPEWRSEMSADVKANGVTRLEFHREVANARTIKGRLLLPDGLAADLNGAIIEIGSLDGETHERLTPKTNDKGEFQFESKASHIGIYARTKDARAATVAAIDRLDQPITLKLNPTGEYRGQLLGKEDRPLNGHAVRAEIYVSRKRDSSRLFLTNFLAASFDAKSDAEGNFSFSGLPCEAAITLSAGSLDGSNQMNRLEDFYLAPHESRPRIVSKLWQPEQKISFTDRYDKTLRDCRLSNYGAMVILYRPSPQTNEFVKANFINSDTTKEIMAFIQIEGSLGDKADPEIEKFAASKHWPLPDNARVFALAMNPTGQELGSIEIDAKDPASPKRAADFIRRYAPAPIDARHKWDEAFAEARRTGRKVWVRTSGRYCGPCFSLTRWLDDQKKILAQEYVFLKIDEGIDLHGAEVAKRLTRSDGQGIPFHVIFDSAGTMLITSESPLGNIGHPAGFEGKKHLRKMILNTRSRLTDQQVDEIVNTLPD